MIALLPIFICEDNIRFREQLESIINQFVFIEELNMEIEFSTHDPLDLLAFLNSCPVRTGVYFLDIDLKHRMNGFILAQKIRQFDTMGTIVFVTTHGELAHLTFSHKISAMDYIIKDNLDKVTRRVQECIKVAIKRYSNDKNTDKKIYQIQVGEKILLFKHDDILYIEASEIPHKLVLHFKTGELEYYGKLKDVAETIPSFYRCHKSIILNPANISSINKGLKVVRFVNGDECLVSRKYLKSLMDLCDNKA